MYSQLAAFALLVTAVPAAGAPPEISIPVEIATPADEWFVYAPVTDAKSVVYVALDRLKAFPSSEAKDPRKLILPPSIAGRYRFVAVGRLGDEQTVRPFTVVVGGAGPGPTPMPPPPDPDVTPGTRRLFIVVVEETLAVANARGAFFGDPSLKARVAQMKHIVRVVDKDVVNEFGQPPADVKRFLDASAGKPWPQLFLVTMEGVQVLQAPLPATPGALLALIQKWGG